MSSRTGRLATRALMSPPSAVIHDGRPRPDAVGTTHLDHRATMAARRFAHGRHSGSFRVRSGIRTRWQMVLGAPLVPFVLLVRVARRVARAPGHRTGFASSAGAFLVLAAAWAAGEAIGGFTAGAEMREALRAA